MAKPLVGFCNVLLDENMNQIDPHDSACLAMMFPKKDGWISQFWGISNFWTHSSAGAQNIRFGFPKTPRG